VKFRGGISKRLVVQGGLVKLSLRKRKGEHMLNLVSLNAKGDQGVSTFDKHRGL
jgi:hypothetical protein